MLRRPRGIIQSTAVPGLLAGGLDGLSLDPRYFYKLESGVQAPYA